ncbi:hypothetical protein [Argonema antarcticum]|uniref:hypothetical protein n=1 Tax=Argonema antarcticum TaxID=2942763 RepID=UPI0020120353|nr:hypothetical protein [Argonema antarcticum]MCL1473905.1 hypothetical protein [Argonema antarcticum A004/B2]
MESYQPFLTYLGIGTATIVVIVAIIWAFLAFRIFSLTKGLPQAITEFFTLISEEKIDQAYQLTTENFRTKTSKQQLIKFIKNNKIKQYKRSTMSIPKVEDNRHLLDIKLITSTGREIPLKMAFVRQAKEWRIDQLETPSVKK